MEKPNATILVIDDEKIIHESCGRVLQEEGYEVETAYEWAGSPREA